MWTTYGGRSVLALTRINKTSFCEFIHARKNCRPNLSRCDERAESRGIVTTAHLAASQAGRFKVSIKHNNPLTYEQAWKPSDIGKKKGWNSLNSTNLEKFGLGKAETSVSDVFIRKFVSGTWHDLFVSEILIKRQHNMIRVAGIVRRGIHPRKMYFLIGYTEELLANWLQMPVKMELQTVDKKEDVIFKYV